MCLKKEACISYLSFLSFILPLNMSQNYIFKYKEFLSQNLHFDIKISLIIKSMVANPLLRLSGFISNKKGDTIYLNKGDD